jgi:hypothetical protein
VVLHYEAREREMEVKGNARSSFWYNLDENKLQCWEMKLLRFTFFSAALSFYQKGPRTLSLVFMIKISVKRKHDYGA